ncbi:hypothetical protein L0244_38305 [bacterium]|nr:hypothetical protein [bacterium]
MIKLSDSDKKILAAFKTAFGGTLSNLRPNTDEHHTGTILTSNVQQNDNSGSPLNSNRIIQPNPYHSRTSKQKEPNRYNSRCPLCVAGTHSADFFTEVKQ